MKNLTSLLVLLFFVSNLQSQTGWEWQNPYPQGNPLYSISFFVHCGWAVGPQGTAIHFCDDTNTWEIVDLGTTENFNAVCMYDDLMTWIVGDNGLILYVMDHTDSIEVTRQTSNTTVNLNSITTNINGCLWISGDEGTVLQSNDMGVTWEEQSVIYNYDLNSLHNIECTEAWAVGPEGFVMHTSDWGISWTYQPTPTNWTLFSVDVGTFENIRVAGQQGLIMHTADMGLTWEIEHEEDGYNLYDVLNVGLNNAYAVGGDATILETIDYGETWTKPNTNIYSNITLYDAEDHWGQDPVWVVGHHGVILKNSGIETEFELQNEGTLLWVTSVEFIDENTGWAVGGDLGWGGTTEGIILHTTDGGENWEELNLSTPLNAVDFVNENAGWAVGEDGLIMRTINGGASWSTENSPVSSDLTSVFFIDEVYGWAVGDYSEIIFTENGGVSWTKQTSPTQNWLYDVFFVNGNEGWAVGLDSTVLHTTNHGETWERIITNVSNGFRFTSVHFYDPQHGCIVGIYGSILVTNDWGETWQEIESGTYESLNSVYFIDQNNGWVVGDAGTILRSVDGGYSWFKQRSGVSTSFLVSVHFTDHFNGWAVGEGGAIIHTTNGGFSHEHGTFWVNGLGLPINDFEETISTIEVDVSEVIRDEFSLTGVELLIDTIIHSRVSDLEIYLSHNDITDTLVFHVTDDGENFLWTRLKDDANNVITDGTAPFSGDHKPYKPLSAFNGLDPNGTWTLTIYDSEAGHTGTLNAWGIKPLFEIVISINEQNTIKTEQKIQLLQNIPNPFYGTTQISWKTDVSGHVVLKIFNIEGREIATLVNQKQSPGKYEVEFDAGGLPSGIYYCRLTVGKYSQTKKMVLMRL